MFNSKFLKGSSYLVGSSLILSSAQGFGAAADLEDVNNEVKGTVNEGAAPAASLGVDCTSEELNDSEKVVSEKSNEDVAVAENVAVPEKSEVELLKELLKTADLENTALREKVESLENSVESLENSVESLENSIDSYEGDISILKRELNFTREQRNDLSGKVESLLSERQQSNERRFLVLNLVAILLIIDCVQAIVRGRKEIFWGKFWCSLDKVIGKYSFFSNIIDGVSLGIMQAWKGASVDVQAEMYRRILNDGAQSNN